MKFAIFLDDDAGIENSAKLFKNHHAAAFEADTADEKIIVPLYRSCIQSNYRDKIRFTIITKYLVENNFNLATLPRTEEAVRLHSWRCFVHQSTRKGQKKKRPNLDNEAVYVHLDEDTDNNFEQEQFLYVTSPKCAKCNRVEFMKKGFNELAAIGGERGMEICMDLFSELCKEVDDLIKKFGVYVKEITDSEECKKIKELVKKPGGQTIFG
ncbi:hypothetical protein AVEN_138043-1 [Araneus ventricosus]|uniref:Uncharacterized protein n=1 Tax=Araneus ventricosus TaxID=182803 RepID=A0A4Y2N0A7_ARAVE|nr:hypothetical protein AVEN_138043-1 [Araneus ventricosus]